MDTSTVDISTMDTGMAKALQHRVQTWVRTWSQISVPKSVPKSVPASVIQTSMVLGSALMIALGHSAPTTALTPALTPTLTPEVSPLPSISPSHPSLSQSVSPITPSEQATALLPKATFTNPYAPATPSYAQPQLDYFLDIAMGSEYGNVSPNIRKWDTDLRIQVHGTPTTDDMATLHTVIHELNTLIDPVDLELLPAAEALPQTAIASPETAPSANVNIHFVPYTEFDHHVPHYQVGNLGYAWIWWENDTIYDATILISSVGLNATERAHLIREELTQSLGLLRDSYRYEDSIFFQLWTTTTNYSAMDETLIQMLYNPKIQPGMNRQDVLAAFSGDHNTDIAVRAD